MSELPATPTRATASTMRATPCPRPLTAKWRPVARSGGRRSISFHQEVAFGNHEPPTGVPATAPAAAAYDGCDPFDIGLGHGCARWETESVAEKVLANGTASEPATAKYRLHMHRFPDGF